MSGSNCTAGWAFCARPDALATEADARLEVALRLVVGVHAEDVGVVVRVLEAHDVDLGAQRNLRDIVHLYGTDATVLDFVHVERVHDPVHVD